MTAALETVKRGSVTTKNGQNQRCNTNIYVLCTCFLIYELGGKYSTLTRLQLENWSSWTLTINVIPTLIENKIL